jgi:2-polyprenyl-6-methoxyphenol hydroxylase-like FAD-dependent oxidoreductase
MQGIIIGGGIGGLTAAIALQQRGIDVHVYEQAPEIREVGAGLVMSANALQVLDWLGLAEIIQRKGWSLQKGLITKPDKSIIQQVDVESISQRFGYGMTTIQRGQLQKVLVEALPANRLHTGKRLVELSQDDQHVRVRFSDGNSVEADFVIGSDGIRSAVRRQIMGEQTLRYSGQTCWRTIVDYALPIDTQTTSVEYWGRPAGLRVGVVPLSSAQVYVYVTAAAQAGQTTQAGELTATLQSIGQSFDKTVQAIFQQIDGNRVFHADLYDLPTLPSWSKGRVTLLGDAAHATTPNLGQGACQAIEDAWAIAACLAQYEPAQAFQNYELLRKRKADQVVQTSRQIGKAVNLPGWLKPLAFAAMRAVPKSVSKRQFEQIYDVSYLKKAERSTASQYHRAPVE